MWGGSRARAVAHLAGKEESGGGGNGSDAEKFEQPGGGFRLGFEGKGAAAAGVYMGEASGELLPARIAAYDRIRIELLCSVRCDMGGEG